MTALCGWCKAPITDEVTAPVYVSGWCPPVFCSSGCFEAWCRQDAMDRERIRLRMESEKPWYRRLLDKVMH